MISKMAYLPHTEAERKEMLMHLGVEDIDDLFADIPDAARTQGSLGLPNGLSEWELHQRMRQLATGNHSLDQMVSFLGSGFYDRYIPSVVPALASRGEFSTAYTPYQPELSQGTLAAIFEFQTMIASLTGMDAAQASLYDGASAAAEAALLAMADTGRKTVMVSNTLHPEVRRVVATYIAPRGGQMHVVDDVPEDDETDPPAAVIWPYPDILGRVVGFPQAMASAKSMGALAVCYADPVSLALLRPPGELDADVAVGEGQALGNPIQYGGPGFGFFAVKQRLIRRLPGRLVGATQDAQGRRGFVLTLQAREQHIRRERATSNVCSNHSLNALRATIYLSLLGPSGLRDIAQLSVNKAHYLKERLRAIGVVPVTEEPVLYEFAVRVPGSIASLNQWLLDRGIFGGVDLGRWSPDWEHWWQLAVTELRTRSELDRLVKEVSAWIQSQ